MTSAADFQLRLKRTLEVLHASDGDSYVLRGGAQAEFVIEAATPDERELLDALAAGVPSLAALRDSVGATDEAALAAHVDELAGLGLLEEPAGDAVALLGTDAAERFDRQLAYFADVRPGEAARLQATLRDARVAIVGVGGLGTWTAAALASAGIGNLTLVDEDTVELSNLNRQVLYRRADVGRPKVEVAAEALTAFDPGLEVTALALRVAGPRDAERVVAGHDFVIELADWPPYDLGRWMEAACWPAGIPRVTAALFPPFVRIGPSYVPGMTPCLACQDAVAAERFPLYDELAALRQSRPTVAATLGPPCALIGGVIAMDVVHHLTGIAAAATLGVALIIDTRDMSVERDAVPRRVDCERCGAGRRAA
jgi:molybdopterin/thiamine biosynthesis adenylyltransferase